MKNAGMLCFFFVLTLLSTATAQYLPEPSGQTAIGRTETGEEVVEVIANAPIIPNSVDQTAYGRTETGEVIAIEPTEIEQFAITVIVRESFIAESQGKLTLLRVQEGSDEERAAFWNAVGISESQSVFLKNQLDELGDQLNEKMEKIEEFAKMNNIADLSPEMLASFDNDISSSYQDIYADMDQIFQESLTPEQFSRAREFETMMPSVCESMLGASHGEGNENMSFAVYETLDLSEEQSDELALIQEDYNAEIKRILDEVREARFENADEAVFTTMTKKIKNLTEATKSKVHDRLTTEQRERLAQIPEKYAAMITKAANESAQEPEDDSWKHAWKPGDPLPEGMKAGEQPASRFPKK